MEKTIRIALSLFCIAAFCTFATAQDNRGHNGHRHMKPEEIAEKQSGEIIAELGLKGSDAEAFRTIYLSYRKDIRSIQSKGHFHKGHRGEEKNDDAVKPSDEDFNRMILDEFDKSQKILDTRKEYYQKFLTVLTPGQVMKMYKFEKHQASQAQHRLMEGQRNHRMGR